MAKNALRLNARNHMMMAFDLDEPFMACFAERGVTAVSAHSDLVRDLGDAISSTGVPALMSV